jgi:hypothetical protein
MKLYQLTLTTVNVKFNFGIFESPDLANRVQASLLDSGYFDKESKLSVKEISIVNEDKIVAPRKVTKRAPRKVLGKMPVELTDVLS